MQEKKCREKLAHLEMTLAFGKSDRSSEFSASAGLLGGNSFRRPGAFVGPLDGGQPPMAVKVTTRRHEHSGELVIGAYRG
jgi:hypothetical protein